MGSTTGSSESQTKLQAPVVEAQQSRAGRFLLLLAISLTLLAFIGTVRFEFVYDDLSQIVSNPHVQSWQYVRSYFTEQVWGHLYPGQPGDYYRPLFLLWLLLNHSLFGLQPGGWHATALSLHLLTTGLVYLLACRLTRDRMGAGIATLFFGLHPVHIEAVAWVSAVCEPLMAAPMLGSLLCYLKQREVGPPRRRTLWQAASLGLFLIAVLFKETALVLPGIIAAYEWLFPAHEDETRHSQTAGLPWRVARAVGPFVVVLAGYLAVRFHVLKGMGRPSEEPLAAVLLTWPSLLWLYLKQLLWPVNISAFYETPWVRSPSLANFILPLVAVVCAIAALCFWARRSRVVAFSTVWLALTIFPPLWGVRYFGGSELAHDRYLYLPSIAVALLLAVAVRKLAGGRAQLFGQPAAQVAAVALVTCFFGAATAMQSVYWANNLLLYSRGVQVAPHNTLAWDHLGTEWMTRNRLDLALEMYQHALAIDPDDWNTNFALGVAYSTAGKLPEADRYLSRACEVRSGYANQFYYLGVVRLRMGKLKEAEAPLRRALAIWPQAVGWHQTLGVVLEREGDLAAARDEFRAELANDPASNAKQQLDEVQARLRAASSPATLASPTQKR
jgi:tetratricopeptide (TPR) repeat protein